MNRKLPLFCFLALFIAFFLEITLFNYTHYATLFTKEHFSIEYNKQEKKFNHNFKNEYWGYRVLEKDSLLLLNEKAKLAFPNLNAEIATIYIEPTFIQGDIQHVKVIWADEESSERSINVSIIKDLNFSNYITIAPRGKVSNLAIVFLDNNIAIKQVELNKKIPFAIMPIRLFIVFAISLLLLCLSNEELREKISYFCFDYLYDKANFRQRLCFALLICSMLAFNFIVSYALCDFKDNEILPKWLKMYSHYQTDALLKKQLHLDIEVPQALLQAERPYDDEYRKQYGLFLSYSKELDNDENAIVTDAAFYKGKYYSYYGMLPVVILFAPYKLLTGNYLPNSIGTFLFASMATILLMLLWKQIAQNYLKKIPYFFFLISAAALYAFSLIPVCTALAIHHIIAQYSALAFVILGVIMLLRAGEKLSIWLLFASSLSFAIAVAGKPSYLLWSILIPVMLWDKRRELINISKIFAIIIPFAIVGSVLAWYNYARFDSPFTFGVSYLMMVTNQGMYDQVGIIGKIHIIVKTFLFVLFNPPNIDFTFPFVLAKKTDIPIASVNYFHIFGGVVGIFCFPIMWFLFYVKKVDILRNFIFAGILISLLNIVLFAFNTITWRYNMDFAWVMAIGALICAFQLQEKEAAMRKVVLKTFYFCCGITLLSISFLTISCGVNFEDSHIPIPKIYYYLARTFGVICNVP